MIKLSAREISLIVNGSLHGDENIMVTQAPAFDSRKAKSGSLFLALIGENTDGHNFCSDAFANGATLALTTKVVDQPCVVVSDVMQAVADLAKFARVQLTNLTVIGITGSQGKTTTKDLLNYILSSVGETVAPVGSFNNELGVPLTILECNEQTKYCIVEMGARHIGDISALCEIAKPKIGAVLKVGNAHIGEFGSREAIAQAKSELVSSLGSGGIAVLGTYDQFTPAMKVADGVSVLTFGERSDCNVRAADVEIREGRPHFDLVTKSGRAAVGMRLVGLHQIPNALAAAAISSALGLSVDQIAGALSMAELASKWRMEIFELDGRLMINDSYNANPESMAAALRTLALFAQERGGSSWAVLGKMHELGASENADHAAIGQLVSDLAIDHLLTVSMPAYSQGVPVDSETKVHQLNDKNSVVNLLNQMQSGDVLLVKASRAEHFEEIAQEVVVNWQTESGKKDDE
jgi:UDP-N-acetylmuramoyl-tripeptide--D-alanyl-D-alanine ligase